MACWSSKVTDPASGDEGELQAGKSSSPAFGSAGRGRGEVYPATGVTPRKATNSGLKGKARPSVAGRRSASGL